MARQPKSIGVGVASTFTGFCALHDSQTFQPVEGQPFTSSPEQVFLLGYRALCHELYLKRASLQTRPFLSQLDRGRPIDYQVGLQEFIGAHMEGVQKAISDLEQLKAEFDALLLKHDYSNMRFYTVTLSTAPDVLCSGVLQPEVDFSGHKLQSLGGLSRPASWIAYSLTATDDGGAAVFSWLSSDPICSAFVKSLDALDDAQIPHALVRFTFEYFENTYFSPDWWNALDDGIQRTLMRRQMTELPPRFAVPRNQDCLQDDGVRSVAWSVLARLASASLSLRGGTIG